MKAKKISALFPVFLLIILLSILWWELFHHKENELPSALINQPLPAFSLTNLDNPQQFFTEKDLQGHVSLLNVWATWCYACRDEQTMLIKIHDQYHVPIYSIDYKDKPELARRWLAELGNPFVKTGQDDTGYVAIDLGVYGTPETFVVDAKGKIRYRHIGVIDQDTWDNVLWPLVKKYQDDGIMN